MDVSIGIMAYNEEKNISHLLSALIAQKTSKCVIREIIVVDDGSIDGTKKIVSVFSHKHKEHNIRLISYKQRRGKSHAINCFLDAAKSPILVLESADTLPEQNTVETLCAPFKDPNVGIVSGHPLPLNEGKAPLGPIVLILHSLHHYLSTENPKFCELIAFRNDIERIPPTCVDEEYIGSLILKKGLTARYVEKAYFHNMGPSRVLEYLRQRRRNHCGHLLLYKDEQYRPSSIRTPLLIRILISELKRGKLAPLFFAAGLECLARTLGRVDYLLKKDYRMWKPALTTKQLADSSIKKRF